MSKSKLITGIILLVVGGGLIPTGFFVNQMFVDQIAGGVPDALLAIEEQALPSLEEQLPPLATPDVLLGVEDAALTSLEEQLPVLATPDVLLGIEIQALATLEAQLPVLATPAVLSGLKDMAVAELPKIINGSGAVKAINNSIYAVYALIYSLPGAYEQWFNNATFSQWYPPTFLPFGPSEYTGIGNLSFTPTAQDRILNGFSTAPGLLDDELGIGLLSWMEFWSYALADSGTNRTMMETSYNATWAAQLYPLGGYIVNYLWDVVVKSTYYPAPIEYVAELMFYQQWANGSVVEDGIDLSLFKDTLPADTKGLEAGVPNPTNITIPTCEDLWNVSNSFSFANDSGFLIWAGAMQGDVILQGNLSVAFSLTEDQLTIVLVWLGNFMTNLVPLLLLDQTGLTVPQLAQLAFYEQWSSGTIQGQSILPDGFLNEISAAFAGAPYFEVGLPSPSGLSIPQTTNLWDEASNYTFVNTNGILVWVGAMQGDTTLQGNLSTAFSFTGTQLPLLLLWLGNFLAVRVPQLIEYETGYTIPELAQLAFYEQWANGTIQGQSMLPDGFLGELNASYAGAPYFEVGLPSPSNLSLADTMNLWNETNANTFVNMDGILVWLGAITNTSLQSALITTFGISAGELTVLLTWLGNFTTVRVPQLMEYETGHTVPELAQLAFYEQWADGTIQGLSILPDGFLSELDPPLLGPPYFEVGLTEGPTGLTASQCAALWNETSEYSLVSASGINKWYTVKKWYEESSSATYDDLRTYNGGLSNGQMTKILDWLPQFRDEIVNPLAKEDLSLPMEPYDLGNTLLIGLGVGGGTLAAVGIVLLILSKKK